MCVCQAIRDAEREKELKLRHTSVQRDLPRPTEVTKRLMKLFCWHHWPFNKSTTTQCLYISVLINTWILCVCGTVINTILGLWSFSEHFPVSIWSFEVSFFLCFYCIESNERWGKTSAALKLKRLTCLRLCVGRFEVELSHSGSHRSSFARV